MPKQWADFTDDQLRETYRDMKYQVTQHWRQLGKSTVDRVNRQCAEIVAELMRRSEQKR